MGTRHAGSNATTAMMSGSATFFGFALAAPLALAFLVTWGDWRLVAKAYVSWVMLLLAAFGLMTGFNLQQTLFGAMTFWFFFSILAVPLLALLWKFLPGLQPR